MSLYVKEAGNRNVLFSSSFTIPITSVPAAGNSLILEIQWNGNGTLNGVTDNASGGSNTWTIVGQSATTASIGNVAQVLCSGMPNGVPTVLTLSFTVGNTNSYSAVIREYTGALTLDKKVGGHDNTTTLTTGSVGPSAATTQATEIVLSSWTVQGAQASWTNDGNYSLPTTLNRYSDGNSARTLLSQYRDVAATGTQSASATWPTAGNYAGLIATYYSGSGTSTNATVVAVPALATATSPGLTASITVGSGPAVATAAPAAPTLAISSSQLLTLVLSAAAAPLASVTSVGSVRQKLLSAVSYVSGWSQFPLAFGLAGSAVSLAVQQSNPRETLSAVVTPRVSMIRAFSLAFGAKAVSSARVGLVHLSQTLNTIIFSVTVSVASHPLMWMRRALRMIPAVITKLSTSPSETISLDITPDEHA